MVNTGSVQRSFRNPASPTAGLKDWRFFHSPYPDSMTGKSLALSSNSRVLLWAQSAPIEVASLDSSGTSPDQGGSLYFTARQLKTLYQGGRRQAVVWSAPTREPRSPENSDGDPFHPG